MIEYGPLTYIRGIEAPNPLRWAHMSLLRYTATNSLGVYWYRGGKKFQELVRPACLLEIATWLSQAADLIEKLPHAPKIFSHTLSVQGHRFRWRFTFDYWRVKVRAASTSYFIEDNACRTLAAYFELVYAESLAEEAKPTPAEKASIFCVTMPEVKSKSYEPLKSLIPLEREIKPHGRGPGYL